MTALWLVLAACLGAAVIPDHIERAVHPPQKDHEAVRILREREVGRYKL